MKRLLGLFSLLIIATFACNLGGLFASPPTASSPTPAPALPLSPAPTLTLSPAPTLPLSLSLIKKVVVTTDAT